jgi:MFS family permease
MSDEHPTHDTHAETDAAPQPSALECEPGPNAEYDELCEIETGEADVEAPPQPVVRRGGTFESFRYPDYSWFWSGALVSNVGTWMQNYALSIVVFALRRSEFDLGLINFISGIPILFLALPAGALADKVDRRRLLIGIQVVLLVQAAILGVLSSTGRFSSANATSALWWIATLGILGGVFAALQFPSWQAMMPDLVPRDTLLNGIALNSAQFQSSRLLGPLAAGALVLAGMSMGGIFYVNAASFLFVIAALLVIRPRFAAPKDPAKLAERGGTLDNLLTGLRYARTNRTVGMLVLSTAVMTFFGFAYMVLLPAFVDKSLGFAEGTDAYKRVVALIMATNGLGAMIGALTIASLPSNVRRNRIIPLSLLGFGLMLAVFSVSRNLWLTAIVSALAGAGLMTTNSLANTSLQAAAPPQIRGRVMALFVMAFMGVMPLCGLAFGILGQKIGPAYAVLAGAIVLIAWSLFLLASGALVKHEAPAAVR